MIKCAITLDAVIPFDDDDKMCCDNKHDASIIPFDNKRCIYIYIYLNMTLMNSDELQECLGKVCTHLGVYVQTFCSFVSKLASTPKALIISGVIWC